MTDITENGKFYIPQVEEFHFGFEFEAYNSREKYFFESEEGWYKVHVSFGVLGNVENLQKLIIDKQLRVKFLDHDDIVEAGWRTEEKSDWLFFGNCRYWAILQYGDHRVTIHRNREVVFDGQILNKSELNFQMKRLGITK